ncbi:MAG: arginine repressor [Clostridiales bacterium]|nr:arginine repressor [Clostridiales bacterium]
MERNERQIKILELISTKNIETQDELAYELKKLNYNVTQATISRDIKELGLVKTRYIAAGVDSVNERIKRIFKLAVLSVNVACNIVVIKTLPGCANATGDMLDKMRDSEVLGCVAGEDTVMAVCLDETAAKSTADKLYEMIG